MQTPSPSLHPLHPNWCGINTRVPVFLSEWWLVPCELKQLFSAPFPCSFLALGSFITCRCWSAFCKLREPLQILSSVYGVCSAPLLPRESQPFWLPRPPSTFRTQRACPVSRDGLPSRWCWANPCLFLLSGITLLCSCPISENHHFKDFFLFF